ncbi:MAG: hypothetical protein SWJ54_04945 [Cyanobacteriota bacterium]|nr:hypothetical protein [Cyanobacteriota bacterium]
MTVLLTLDILVLTSFVITELYIEGDEAGELLTDQAQAELATLERIYNYSIEESGLISEATANNLAIINAAQNYNNQGQISSTLQKQVNQILLENEGNTESAKKTFLVSKDLKIIADSDFERIGQSFESETLINSVLSNPQQIITNRLISGQKLQQKFPELTSLIDTDTVITQYTFTPVITSDTRRIEAVLVSVKLLTGKESILKQSLVTIGGGYHAVYLQKQSGEFTLITSLLDLESHEFGQHHLHDEQYHLQNFPLPNTLILEAATQVEDEAIIQRMSLKKHQYTVAAKILTDTLDGAKVILVREDSPHP